MKRQLWIKLILWIVVAALLAAALAMAILAIVGATYQASDYGLRLVQSKEGRAPSYQLFRAQTKGDAKSMQPLENADFALFAMTDKDGNLHLKEAYVLYKLFLALLLIGYALCVIFLLRYLARHPQDKWARGACVILGIGLCQAGTTPYLLHFAARAILYGRAWAAPQSLFGWASIGAGVVLLMLSLLLPKGTQTEATPLPLAQEGQEDPTAQKETPSQE